MEQYKYFAFISYNSHDTEWGKRVQKKLEGYKMPATLCSEHGWERKPLKPVFFAPTDIQPGGLTEELQERLRASRHLIVICSPSSARSEWVGREIAFFHQLGRTRQIHFFIVDGEPHSGNPATECFNPVVQQLGMPELLGANVNERIYRWSWLNRERAYVQLISKLLGVEFDSIWQRHRRRMVRNALLWGCGVLAVLLSLLAVWRTSQPVDVAVGLNEVSAHNEQLPPLRDAMVTLTLDNETKTDTIAGLSSQALFANIPRRYIGRQARLQFSASGYQSVDTLVSLTAENILSIRRDEAIYGDVRFRLWNPRTERGVGSTAVTIDGMSAESDAEGRVQLHVPLPLQKPAYAVSATVPLDADSLYMPCGPDDVVSVR